MRRALPSASLQATGGERVMQELSDPGLVERAQAGDQTAFAALARRYFAPLYDFVLRLTRDHDETEALVGSAFEEAMYDIGGLPEGVSFRSWLFTIARNATLEQLQRSPAIAGAAVAESEFGSIEPDRLRAGIDEEEAEGLAPLVVAATAALDPRQLSLLDLQLRHGLDSAELADVAGISLANSEVMLGRLYSTAEDSVRASILAETACDSCRDLARCLAAVPAIGPGLHIPDEVRRAVDSHIATCATCQAICDRAVPPLLVFAAFGAVPAPAGSAARVIDSVLQSWPSQPQRRRASQPTASMTAFQPPPPDDRPGHLATGPAAPFPHVLRAFVGLGAAAALLIAFLVIPASPIALTRSELRFQAPATGTATSAGASPPGTVFVIVPETATATPTLLPVGTSGAGPGASVSATSSAAAGAGTPTPTSTPVPATATPTLQPTLAPPTATPDTPTSTATTRPLTPTPTATPCIGALTTNLIDNRLNASSGSTSFEVLNQSNCASGAYRVVVDDKSPWLTVSPSAGALSAHSQDTIGVTADLSQVPSGAATVLGITWPGGAFTITVVVNGPD